MKIGRWRDRSRAGIDFDESSTAGFRGQCPAVDVMKGCLRADDEHGVKRFADEVLDLADHLWIEHLVEPDDMRASDCATLTTGWEIRQGNAAILEHVLVGHAPEMPQAAVDVDDVPASRAFMEVIHVLRDDGHPPVVVLRARQGPVGWVGFRAGDDPTPHVVPLPHQNGIALERFGGREILGPVVLPPAAGIAEGGDTAFRRYAGTGDDEEILRVVQDVENVSVPVLGAHGRPHPLSWAVANPKTRLGPVCAIQTRASKSLNTDVG